MKRLIVTGDDFGISMEVNEAIEETHRQGILTTASLIIVADAAVDAIDGARRLPSLRVGLHLVVVDSNIQLVGSFECIFHFKQKIRERMDIIRAKRGSMLDGHSIGIGESARA